MLPVHQGAISSGRLCIAFALRCHQLQHYNRRSVLQVLIKNGDHCVSNPAPILTSQT